MSDPGPIIDRARSPEEKRRLRSAALRGAALVAVAVLGIAAARGVLDLWLVVGAAATVAASAFLPTPKPPGRQAGNTVAHETRLAAADTILANIPDPVVLVDRRSVVREANAAAQALLPMLKAGRPLSFALRAPDVLDGIEEVLKSGEPLKVEYAQRLPTERTFEVQIGALTPFAGEAGGQPGLVLFFRDLTSARRLETMRVDFIANVSHELRTPLASLLGFIETLQGPARDDASARDRFLEIMREQARRMARLIDDLLSLSRIELRAHVQPQTPVDMAVLVREVSDALRLLARERDVDIVVKGGAEPAVVFGDRDELLRVAENLIENAIKYGGGGKRVEVALQILPASLGRSRQIELAVTDHGLGIAPEHLPRLTERFYRVDVSDSRQKGGTGLGLAIVKHIVNRHRGKMTIESEPGQGATFRVTIPEAFASDAHAATGAA